MRSEVRAGSLQCESDTGLWFRLQRRCLAWRDLVVVLLYVWKELKAAGLFWFGEKNMQLEQLQRGA